MIRISYPNQDLSLHKKKRKKEEKKDFLLDFGRKLGLGS